MTKRTKQLHFRTDDKEHDLIVKNAEDNGFSKVADYIRERTCREELFIEKKVVEIQKQLLVILEKLD